MRVGSRLGPARSDDACISSQSSLSLSSKIRVRSDRLHRRASTPIPGIHVHPRTYRRSRRLAGRRAPSVQGIRPESLTGTTSRVTPQCSNCAERFFRLHLNAFPRTQRPRRDGGCHEEGWRGGVGLASGSGISDSGHQGMHDKLAADICDGALAPCCF